MPNSITLYYCKGSATGEKKIASARNNQNREFNLNEGNGSYNPTYVWLYANGEYSEPIRVSGTNTITFPDGKELSIAVTTETPKSTVTGSSLNVNIPIPPTGVLYLWAFDQGLRTFSNSTVVDAANIQIGGDKTITKTGAANWDEMRILATTKDLCANYKDDDDVPDAPEWRVPNQRELTIMNLYPTELKLVGTSKHAYFSCTKYSNAVNASQPEGAGNNRRYSFVIENQKGLTYGGGVIAVDTRATSFHVRCVRDLAPSEDPNNEGSDDNFGQGDN